jgi:AraC-like DNA-binding protein
MTDRARADAQ